jgi:mRNA interferase MazF
MQDQTIEKITEQVLKPLRTKFEVQESRIKKMISATKHRKTNIIQESSKRFIKTMKSEVWTCDFGENVGAETNGICPCLIIQADVENEQLRNTIVLPIHYSQPIHEYSIWIEPTDIEYIEESLRGFVLSNRVQSISKARLGRKIGKLTEAAMKKIGDQARTVMGL